VTPHVAQKIKCSAIDGRTTRHAGYASASANAAGRGSVRLGQDHRRLGQGESARAARVRFKFTFAMAAYNLIRMPRLLAAV